MSCGAPPTPTASCAPLARQFAADGSPIGGEIRIDEPMAGRAVGVAKVVGLEGGGYAVTWQSRSPDFDQWAVAIRHVRADASLSAVRQDVVRFFHTYDLVSLAGGGYGRLLQGTADGGFVVAWDTPDRQRPGEFVYARRFDAQGNPMGVPTRVDAAAPPESMPVARSVGEGFVITWAGLDADDSGIFARHFRSGALQ